jgi:hypothetical protein
MNDPVCVSIPLEGYDKEARAINAVVVLLETTSFHPMFPGPDGHLTADQRARVARYLSERYTAVGKTEGAL